DLTNLIDLIDPINPIDLTRYNRYNVPAIAPVGTRPEGLGGSRDAGPAVAGPRPPKRLRHGYGYGYGCTGRTGPLLPSFSSGMAPSAAPPDRAPGDTVGVLIVIDRGLKRIAQL
ncbi:hypothetical protein L249_5507, partial [Ophiocordyceps polyrhachis-furcata BCC 54312]